MEPIFQDTQQSLHRKSIAKRTYSLLFFIALVTGREMKDVFKFHNIHTDLNYVDYGPVPGREELEQFIPVCSVIAGFLCQDIVRMITGNGKLHPIENTFVYDASDAGKGCCTIHKL